MANKLFDATTSSMKEAGIAYTVSKEDYCICVSVGKQKNLNQITVEVFFDSNEHTVALRGFNLVKFAEGKKAAMYQACSKINEQFRWVKFWVSEQDNTVTAALDTIAFPQTAGDQIIELCIYMFRVCDDAYPILLKTIYA